MTDLTVQNETVTITTESTYGNIYVYVNGVLNIEAQVYANTYEITGSGAETNIYGAGALDIQPVIVPGDPGGYIYDEFGVAIDNIIFSKLVETYASRLVGLKLPGVNKEILQNIGSKNKIYVLYGTVSTSLSSTLTALENNIGKRGYVMSSLVPQTDIVFKKISIRDSGRRPLEFTIILEMVEYI